MKPNLLPNAALLLLAATTAVAVPPPAPDALTEQSAASWSAVADGGFSAVLTNDSVQNQVGGWALKLDTTAPFDCYFWTPQARNANWDLSAVSRLQFWVYAVNTNTGFQGHSPWIILGSNGGTIRYQPNYDLLNDARNVWYFIDIPVGGNSTWQRTDTGPVTLADVDYIEIHADTWEAGFQLWVDGLTFEDTPPPVSDLTAIAGNAKVSLAWPAQPPVAAFSHFAVYRSTSAFTSVAGMTPIATIANSAATSHEDATAVNGVSYHYAVTVVATGGAEETQVESVGPRTPRNETDLQVVYIERTPKYPRYDPIYTGYTITEPSGFGPYFFTAATGLGSGQTAGTQRFPNIGQTVTYTAHVRNRGTNSIAGPISVAWSYDGSPIGSTNIPGPLAPGQVASVSINRTWDGQAHDLNFTINLPDVRAGNNALTIDTNAVGFLSYIDQTYAEEFREDTLNYPLAETDDFIDWLNYHMQVFNDMFAAANSNKRVRFDKLEMLTDFAPDPSVATINYAIFPFRYRHTEFGGGLRTTGYYHSDVDIDFGLLHEKGHQLGLIDIYRFDLPGSNNLASGRGYVAVPCLMHGVDDFLSLNSALAMNHWYSKAHGYYGQYMYSLPQNVTMRFLNPDGEPIEGATVKMYQKVEVPGQGEIIPNQVKATGVTNANGEWTLPNVPINPAQVPTTFAGDTLNANPFGYIAVVGTNGVLHFRVEKDGAVDYAWLDVLEVNNAYWQGETVNAVFDRLVAVGGPVQPFPPPELTENNAVDWSAGADSSSPQATFVVDETTPSLVQVGQASIKFVTDGGFDAWVRYPNGLAAQWDLSSAVSIKIRLRTVNANIGFQGGSPWIRLGDNENNYFEYRYYQAGNPIDLLNETRNVWRSYTIPLNAPTSPFNGWGRTIVGTPSFDNIQYFEMHADTWGAGFTMWVDGLMFDPPPCMKGDFNADGVRNGLDVALFTDAFLGGASAFDVCAGDFSGNQALDVADVDGFVQCVLDAGGCP